MGRRTANGAEEARMAELAGALRHLGGIKLTSGDAANNILGACEELMEACEGDAEALCSAVEKAVTEIMTACSFDDLISQQATKVTASIEHVLASGLRDVSPRPVSAESDEGLGHAAERLQQDSVDALLAELASAS